MSGVTKEYLVSLIDGAQFDSSVLEEAVIVAKENGLVIVQGYSDDIIDLSGVINHQEPAYEGGCVLLVDGVPFESDSCESECVHFKEALRKARSKGVQIRARWCEVEDYSWAFETVIPHCQFDVLGGSQKFCRGIVFSLDDLRRVRCDKN